MRSYSTLIDPAVDGNYAIRMAAGNGHIKVVKCMLEKKEENPRVYGSIDPAAGDNHAIRLASSNGHIEVVRYLLEKKAEHPELYRGINLE